MAPFARFRKSELQRALNAAKECGFEDVRVRIEVDGAMEIIVGKSAGHSEPVELE